MKSVENMAGAYARFIARHPVIVLLFVVLLVGYAVYLSSNIENVNSDYDDMIPDSYEVIRAIKVIGDNFGGTDSVQYVLEVDPRYAGSNEPRNIMDPEVIRYTSILGDLAGRTDDVVGVSSAATFLKSVNEDTLPKSKSEISVLTEDNPGVYQYVSADHTLSIIKISLTDTYDTDVLISDLENVISTLDQPSGIIVQVAGEIAVDPVINREIAPDMAKTSNFSIIAILVILLVMMRSIRFSAMPLITIGVGVVLTFGYMAMRGMDITPQTSGVTSMIMGIGIDFGIQTVTRFRQERKKYNVEESLVNTMKNVFIPMSTTTLAALIGFKAMTMGELTLMAELGTVMSYGVAACYVAALTVLPAMMVITERIARIKITSKIFTFIKNSITKPIGGD